MNALIARKEVLKQLTEKIHQQAGLYKTFEMSSLVLFFEAFGFRFTKNFFRDHLRSLAKSLRKLIVNQNPLYGYYLSCIYLMSLNEEPELAQAALDTVSELVKCLNSKDRDKWNKWLIRTRVLEEELRRFLVSAALSVKYLVELCKEHEWEELARLYAGEVFEDVWRQINQRHKTKDLDPITLAALLTLCVHINEIRRKLGLPSYQTKDIEELWEILEERIDSFGEIVKASVVALLYDLYTSPHTNADVRVLFLRLESSISFDRLSMEFAKKISEGREEVEFYVKYYELEEAFPILGLDEVEYMLLARFLKVLKEEYIYIPSHGLSEFVSKYYHVPEKFLKAFLYVRYYKLHLYRLLLRFSISRLGIPMIISVMLGTLLYFFEGVVIAVLVGVVPIFVSLFVPLCFKNVVERIMHDFLEEWLMNRKKKLNDISKEIEGERWKLKHFKQYIRIYS
jgi:hypothetical protein